MEEIILNNGIKMPQIGYGVYQIPATITEQCVADALNVGYRSIDTAQCYGNERAVSAAVRKSGVRREQIFITTKLWGCTDYRDAQKSIDDSLKLLDSDYIDLLLIHEPTGNIPEIYRAMEDALKTGKLRAIGVANFLEDTYAELVKRVTIVPAVNQVEMHVFRQQVSLRKLMQQHGTQPESWAPLAEGKNGFFTNPTLSEIGKAHGKTIAQVGLRFLYQQGIVIIPKSVHKERMIENRDILDFSLTDEEMNRIRTLDRKKSFFNWW